MTQEAIRRQLAAADLVLTDLTLYLDTHPEDTQALAVFNQYKEITRQARAAYIQAIGPLTVTDVDTAQGWEWADAPWPWEEVCHVDV